MMMLIKTDNIVQTDNCVEVYFFKILLIICLYMLLSRLFRKIKR